MAGGKVKAKARPRKNGIGLAGKLACLFALGGALAALPLCLVIIPGMMPSLMMLLIDRQRPRYSSYTVAAMNFAGIVPFLLAIAKAGMSLTLAAKALSEPFTWLVMYGAAAGGWLICGATPIIARGCVELQLSQKRRALEALAKAIREEWGAEVAETAKKN